MIKSIFSTSFFAILIINIVCAQVVPGKMQSGKLTDPWTKDQLMEPSVLAAILIKSQVSKPLIFNIGVMENIKGAKKMGASSDRKNLELFKKTLIKIPKNTVLVIYCGCCPFERCPNIRPAFQALKDAGFKNGKLLNLPTNIKTDWINKGYPAGI
ncbi:rhodanese-like domain-containing protein [Pedobacter sp. P351]|uniref:rhodanese-like domain-containing protein n=1 Tax=Pedobacter superstes TaxID=3133441 RepID=UPI0030B0D401